MLAEAETEELNFILLNINCSALAEVVSRPTMDMLTGSDQRLPELHVLARLVLHATHSLDHITLTGVSIEKKPAKVLQLESKAQAHCHFNRGRIVKSVHAFKHDVLTV